MPLPKKQLLSRTVYDTDGLSTIWDFAFSGGYLDKSHVKAFTLSDQGVRTDLVVATSQLVGPFQLQIAPALASGQELFIYRDTPKDLPLVNFTDESGFSEIALDTNAKQAVFLAAEAFDTASGYNAPTLEAAAASAVVAASTATAAAASAVAALGTLTGQTTVTSLVGDGFNLSFAVPLTDQRARTDVFVGGVYQNRSAYTLTTGLLTFAEAPPVAPIELVTNVALPIGALDWVLISQGPAGSMGQTVVLSSLPGWGSYTEYKIEVVATLSSASPPSAQVSSAVGTPVSTQYTTRGYNDWEDTTDADGLKKLAFVGLPTFGTPPSGDSSLRGEVRLLPGFAGGRCCILTEGFLYAPGAVNKTVLTSAVSSFTGTDRVTINFNSPTTGALYRVFAK